MCGWVPRAREMYVTGLTISALMQIMHHLNLISQLPVDVKLNMAFILSSVSAPNFPSFSFSPCASWIRSRNRRICAGLKEERSLAFGDRTGIATRITKACRVNESCGVRDRKDSTRWHWSNYKEAVLCDLFLGSIIARQRCGCARERRQRVPGR